MRKITILLALVAVLIYSCGPSVEGEANNWKSNLEQLNKIKSDYPAYAELVSTKITEATKIFNSAESISDKDKKAAKMREANNMLTSGCVGNLKNMKRKLEDVKKAKSALKNALHGKSDADMKYANIILDDCKDAVKSAKKILMKGEKITGNPCNQIEYAYTGLEGAEKDLKKALSNFKRKDEDKKEEAKKKKKDEKKKVEAAKPIKCPYCDVKNDPKAKKCSACGAPLK